MTNDNSLIKLDGIKKVFFTDEVETHALSGIQLDIRKGEITFRAREGRLVDLDKLHESIWATRLSGGTGMALNWLDVTAVGEVISAPYTVLGWAVGDIAATVQSLRKRGVVFRDFDGMEQDGLGRRSVRRGPRPASGNGGP